MKTCFITAIALILSVTIAHAQHTVVDPTGANNGTLHPSSGYGLVFGNSWSGEGIASDRIFSGGSENWNGLDFYTNGTRRLSLNSSGRVGIGTLPYTWSHIAIHAQSTIDNYHGVYVLSQAAGGMVGVGPLPPVNRGVPR